MYSTQSFLDYIRIKIANPPLSDTQILLLASNELADTLFPQIRELRQGFGQTFSEQPLEGGEARYHIPDRAVGNTVVEAKLRRGNSYYNLSKINPGEITTTTPTSRPTAFYFSDDDLVLSPPPSGSDYTLVLWYERTPSDLVLTTQTSVITNINALTRVVTVSDNRTNLQGSHRYDIASTMGSQSIRWADAEATCSGTDITFTDELPKDLKLGDSISIAGETSLIQLPQNYRTALAERVCELILESTGDYDAAQIHKAEFQELMYKAGKAVTPRITYENPLFFDPW